MLTFEVLIRKMQRILSNNDMTNSGEGPPTFDWVTDRFLTKTFKVHVLRSKDAIVITSSCIVAYTLEKQGLASLT
jgi:hypothetical protein